VCQAAIFGRDPNWGRIACAVGYSGIHFNADELDISLGVIPLMKNGQPLPFDRLETLAKRNSKFWLFESQ
jgi:glutamate N-acetyltransferase/amino-acid N-acetyltransferase